MACAYSGAGAHCELRTSCMHRYHHMRLHRATAVCWTAYHHQHYKRQPPGGQHQSGLFPLQIPAASFGCVRLRLAFECSPTDPATWPEERFDVVYDNNGKDMESCKALIDANLVRQLSACVLCTGVFELSKSPPPAADSAPVPVLDHVQENKCTPIFTGLAVTPSIRNHIVRLYDDSSHCRAGPSTTCLLHLRARTRQIPSSHATLRVMRASPAQVTWRCGQCSCTQLYKQTHFSLCWP